MSETARQRKNYSVIVWQRNSFSDTSSAVGNADKKKHLFSTFGNMEIS
jgi:hypothetical protein